MSNYAKRRQAEAEEKAKSIRKTTLYVLCAVAVVALLVGGGYYLKNKKANESASGNVIQGDPDYDVFDYVTLGDYEGVEAYYVTPEVTDEDLQNKIDSTLESAKEYTEFTNRGVKAGDKVTIDFDGKIDGKAFDGGSGTDHEYVLGEKTMIDGFDEGLYGHKKDETVTLNLKFPEDYDNADVAGKDVVFEVTIKTTKELTYDPKFDDAFADKNTEGKYKTAAEYKEALRQELLDEATETSKNNLKNDVWTAVYENAKIDGYPEYLYNKMKAQVNTNLSYYSQAYGISVSDYLNYFAGGVSLEDYIMQYVNANLVSDALIKTLNIEISDDEYQKLAEEQLATYGAESIEDLESKVSKDDLISSFKADKLYDYLVEKANVKEVSQEEYDTIKSAKEAVDQSVEKATEEDSEK